MASAPVANKLLEFLSTIGKLKHLARTGWIRKGISNPETVSGHMYRMAIISFFFSKEDGVDSHRVLKMSLVHDMAESIVGDITPYCNVSVDEKYAREKAAMEHFKDLLGSEVGEEMFQLFLEYEGQNSKESQIVRDLDKFDMILQAFEYEKSEKKYGALEEFFQSTEGTFKNEKVKEWVKELKNQRFEMLKDSH